MDYILSNFDVQIDDKCYRSWIQDSLIITQDYSLWRDGFQCIGGDYVSWINEKLLLTGQHKNWCCGISQLNSEIISTILQDINTEQKLLHLLSALADIGYDENDDEPWFKCIRDIRGRNI